jgi:hypothetical protein
MGGRAPIRAEETVPSGGVGHPGGGTTTGASASEAVRSTRSWSIFASSAARRSSPGSGFSSALLLISRMTSR